MKYPTLLSLLCALLFLNASALTTHLPITPASECASCDSAKAFSSNLRLSLRTDQLIDSDASVAVRIEFEFHDLFVNEQILSYELTAKYSRLLRDYGIQPGAQRQIHLLPNGELLIGDFGPDGKLL